MAFCPKCGTNNPDTATFCSGCGSSITPNSFADSTPTSGYGTGYQAPAYNPAPTYPSASYPSSAPTANTLPVGANVMSIISMVCGILSCLSLYVGFIFAIPALILAGVSKSKTPSGLSNGKSTAGLITGIIGIVLSIIWVIIFVAIFEEATSHSYNSYYDYYY